MSAPTFVGTVAEFKAGVAPVIVISYFAIRRRRNRNPSDFQVQQSELNEEL
jgi:hypothetical protein